MNATIVRRYVRSTLLLLSVAVFAACGGAEAAGPTPLLEQGKPVDWWFVFKFNSGVFAGCRAPAQRACLFGGKPQDYPKAEGFGQQYVFSSSANPTLQEGGGCAGDTTTDPL